MTKHAKLIRENKKWPDHLVDVPRDQWPVVAWKTPMRMLRSRRFLVQVYDTPSQYCAARITIGRTDILGAKRDGITWDTLQRLKREAGFGDKCALEVYPPDSEIINDAPMRHLFVMNEPPDFMWRS